MTDMTSSRMASPVKDKMSDQPDQPEKSKNQLKNEAKKSAKLEKFAAKQAKQATTASTVSEKSTVKAKDSKKTGESPVFVDSTVPGEKKDMTLPMTSAYEPRQVEAAWYSWWEAQGFFKPDRTRIEKKGAFTMVLPPPNVTGSLHLGHAMMGSIEDSLARWHRMNGKAVLFLPGCDHAGIATQAVVEKKLKREQNITKHDLGREEFVKQIWKWKDQYGSKIYDQLKRMGLSLDWSRARFTLDDSVNTGVNEAFCRLFEDGLIFRANRLVNWSGKLKTALSDLEVDMKEIPARSFFPAHNHDSKKTYPFGVIWSFAYKVEGSDTDEIVIPTTRPETLFADTAVAVNPKDQRYVSLHGKKVIHPITGRLIPIITDEAADPEFGTGALKISPAHDPIDFAVAQRHSLPVLCILDEDNRLNAECGPEYQGLERYEARLKVIEDAKRKNVYRGDKDHPMVLPVCSRSGDFVEPRMMPQWWLNCKSMADQSMAAVQEGLLKIVPDDQIKVWNNWLGNIRDWCLSRQLWWGHQIPAYEVILSDGSVARNQDNEPVWVVGRTHAEALDRAKKIAPDASVRRDADVLDTWFSSGLWPITTLGWPLQTDDMASFYPTSLLETGSDILFFWVARMVMLGIHLTGQVPFSSVFLHSIVRDAHGRKMSKSLGNVIDPIDVIEGITLEQLHQTLAASNLDPSEVERAKQGQKLDFPNGIPECGTDALRFALCSYVSHGRDVNLNVNEVHACRRFCNKLWQANRFALMTLGDGFAPLNYESINGDNLKLSLFDRWILARLNDTIKEANSGFESYVLLNVTKALYSFWLNDLCDVYIEAIKPIVSSGDPQAVMAAKNVLFKCIHDGLLLLHPLMPFLTEELYQRLPRHNQTVPSICIAPYPEHAPRWQLSADDTASFAAFFDTVKEIRSIASDRNIPRGASIVLSGSDASDPLAKSMCSLIKAVGTLALQEPSDTGDQLFSTNLSSNPACKVSFYPKKN